MRMLRLFLLIATMIATLPWGAYSGARVAGLVSAPPAITTQTTTGETAMHTTHRCRTATLAGSPCGPDLALVPPAPTLPEAPGLSLPRDAPAAAAQGEGPQTPRRPPRLI